MKKFVVALVTIAAATARAELTFEPEEPAAPAPAHAAPLGSSTPEVSFQLASRLALDLAHDSPAENTAALLHRAKLSVTTRRGDWRLRLSAKARWVSSEEMLENGSIPLLDGTRRRSHFDLLPSELSAETTRAGIDLSFGLLDFSWGQNPLFATADQLVPVDLRDGPLSMTDSRLATPGLRARGTLGPVRFDAVYVPFFVPSRLPLFGNDWTPYGNDAPLAQAVRALDPSLLGPLESLGFATAYPTSGLASPQGGLRLSTRVGDLDVALTWNEHFDRTPRVTYTPAFERLMDATARADAGAQLSTLVEVQSDLSKGSLPFTADFLRTRTISLDAAWSLDRLRLTLDAGGSPRRVFVTDGMKTTVHPALSAAVGLEWEGPPILAAGVSVQAVPGVPAGERLLLLDDDATVARNRTASMVLAYALVSHTWSEDRFSLQAAAMASLRGDLLIVPRLGWTPAQGHGLALGALYVDGPPGGPGALYRPNREAFVEYRLQL